MNHTCRWVNPDRPILIIIIPLACRRPLQVLERHTDEVWFIVILENRNYDVAVPVGAGEAKPMTIRRITANQTGPLASRRPLQVLERHTDEV